MAKNQSNKNSSGKKESKVSPKAKTKKKVLAKKTPTKKSIPLKKRKLTPNKGLGLYIRVKSLVWHKYKEENTDYVGLDYRNKESDFLKVVHTVYDECKATGSDCPNYVVIAKYQQISRGLVRPEPFVSPNLIGTPKPYWEITDLPFDTFEPYLWIVSPMIVSPPSEFLVSEYIDIKGSGKLGYATFFRQWVDWCNDEFQENEDEDYGAYFELQKPVWNEKEKRWELDIYITTAAGEIDSFGYVPSGGSPIKVEPKKVDVEPKAETKKAGETETQKKLRQAQIKEVEAKTVLHKVEALGEKKRSYLDELKTYKELGMEKESKNVMKKITITNLQIEKLTK